MITGETTLKKINEYSFEEIPDKEDKYRPKWNRSFNNLDVTLKNVEFVHSFSTHDLDIWGNVERKHPEKPSLLIKPNISDGFRLTAIVDEDELIDNLYFFEKNDKENATCVIERPSQGILVTIREAKPYTEENEYFPKGIYFGSVVRCNFNSGEDYVAIELSLPKEQL